MKIAIIGSRGIPAKYGGFETFADGFSTRLADKGYEIVVSCEHRPINSRPKKYKKVYLSYFPLKPPKSYFLRKFYETLSDLYFLFKLSRRSDYIYFLGTEVGIFLFIPFLLNRKVNLWVNIDGVMWKRNKFNRLEKGLLKLNHNFATIFADQIIADAKEMKKYVNPRYQHKAVYIPYGISPITPIYWDSKYLKKIQNYEKIKDLRPNEYWLAVARLEPENNIQTIVKGFSKAKNTFPLIIVGDFTSTNFQKKIEEITNFTEDIIFLGAIHNLETLNMLRQNCFAYIHGHSVGGTNPSLLEAMIMENIIIAHDNKFNREVCGDKSLYFEDSESLKVKIESVERNVEEYVKLKFKVSEKVKKEYSWNLVIKKYMELLVNNK